MVQHVYERAIKADLDALFFFFYDDRIKKTVESFGGKVIITNSNHASGTDRCAEAATILNLNETDFIINIQGDEPFIRKEEINLLIRLIENQHIQIATFAKPISTEEELNNPNKVKVVFTTSNRALYFSRSPIPYKSQISNLKSQISILNSHKHLGIYAYRNDILQKITQLPVSILEETEKLEQLRWLENDFTIHVAICHHESIAIDTPEDIVGLKD
jgi:3-deoxy-manno-octulosonate cytidylyltransferase (CMP-KDO synthetase)